METRTAVSDDSTGGISKTATKCSGDQISNFVNTKSIKPFASNTLLEMITEPIKFRAQAGMAYGYDATILPELCEAVLKARNLKFMGRLELR